MPRLLIALFLLIPQDTLRVKVSLPEEDDMFRRSGFRVPLADWRTIDNARDVLRKLAHESGAESFFPRSDAELAKAVEEITNDIRSQYTLIQR